MSEKGRQVHPEARGKTDMAVQVTAEPMHEGHGAKYIS